MKRAWWIGAVAVCAFACSGKAVVDGTAGSGGSGTGGSKSSTGTQVTSGGGIQQGTVAASTGTAMGCNPACGVGLTCCSGKCINPANDVLNCGTCTHKCDGAHPFCNGGTCGMPPCTQPGPMCPGGGFCCGNQCCGAYQLCCNVQMGGPSGGPACTAPVNGSCPVGCPGCVCAAPETSIATPSGNRAIAELRAGDAVYSVDHGRLAVVRIAAVQRNPVHQHRVMRIELDDGSVLRISPRHPTADGRSFGDLARGQAFGAGRIAKAELVDYPEAFTYDILPASDTGSYFAGGVLIGSTMAPRDASLAGACFADPLR